MRQRTAVLLIALHGDVPMRDCLKLLHEAGYQVFRMDGQALAADAPFVDEIYAMPAA